MCPFKKHASEYRDILDEHYPEELFLIWIAINNSVLQEELYRIESPLLAFIIDSELQEKLYLFIEDNYNEFLVWHSEYNHKGEYYE